MKNSDKELLEVCLGFDTNSIMNSKLFLKKLIFNFFEKSPKVIKKCFSYKKKKINIKRLFEKKIVKTY